MQWTLLVACLAAWACGIYFWNLTGSVSFLVFMLVAGVVPLIVRGPVKRWLALVAQRRRVEPGRTLEFRIGDDAVGGMVWEQIVRAGTTPDGIVIVTHVGYLWLPDDGFANAAERTRVEELLARKTTVKSA